MTCVHCISRPAAELGFGRRNLRLSTLTRVQSSTTVVLSAMSRWVCLTLSVSFRRRRLPPYTIATPCSHTSAFPNLSMHCGLCVSVAVSIACAASCDDITDHFGNDFLRSITTPWDWAMFPQCGVSVTRAMKYLGGHLSFSEEDAEHLLTKVKLEPRFRCFFLPSFLPSFLSFFLCLFVCLLIIWLVS